MASPNPGVTACSSAAVPCDTALTTYRPTAHPSSSVGARNLPVVDPAHRHMGPKARPGCCTGLHMQCCAGLQQVGLHVVCSRKVLVGSSTQLTDVWNQKLIQDIPSTMDGVLPFSISGSKETTRVDRPKFTFSAWYDRTRPTRRSTVPGLCNPRCLSQSFVRPVLLLFLTGSRQSGRRLVMPFANHWDRTASRIHSRMPTTSGRSVHAPSSGWPPGRAPVPPRQQLSLSLPSSPPFHPLLQSCKSKNGS